MATLHVGDVVEFGSHPDRAYRWFGYQAHYSAENGAVVVCGPFATPEAAEQAGRDLRDDLESRALGEYREARLANALVGVPLGDVFAR